MKLLISDYDSTFYLNDIDIKKNIKLIKEFRKDNIFVIATGRSFKDFKEKEEKYGIKYDYLIIDHGASIIKNNKYIYNVTINNDIKNKLNNLLKLDLEEGFCCYQGNSRASINNNELTKIHINFGNINKALESKRTIENSFKEHLKCYCINSNQSLEIVNEKVDKSKAIEYIRNLENINMNDVFTIGDSYTDIEMLKTYNGYAMQNSIPDLKKFSKVKNVSELICMLINDNETLKIDSKQ